MKYIIKFLDLRDENKYKCYLQVSAYADGIYINTCTKIVTKSKATRLPLSIARELQIEVEKHEVLNKTPFIIEVEDEQ